MEVQVELSKIIINEAVDQQIIVLKELNGDRSFPIVIGMSEAMAIERRSKGIELPRPMTHDLLASVIEQMEGKIEKVVISDLANGTFYALLHVEVDGNKLEIDSRPSDAIALSAGTDVRLFVDEEIFQKTQM